MRQIISSTLALAFAVTLRAEPPQVAALQEQIRTMIDAAEPSVAAIVVSSNPAYPPLTTAEKAKPGVLGAYRSPGRRSDGIVPIERDKLELSDPRNAADNTFGSGLVLAEDGRVLTNWHLVENARKIYVRFADGKGSYADIHAADARSDLAVLRLIDAVPNRKRIKLANVRIRDEGKEKASVYRGQFVIALAHPFAAGFSDGKASASWGMLSNIGSRAPTAGGEETRQGVLHQYHNLLQTDARLNLGASGGALLNLDGEAIGLLSATAAVAGSEASGGYALPMDPIYRRIIDVLKEGREVEYGFLGVAPQPGWSGRLIINSVTENSPASMAAISGGRQQRGLKDGDEILSVDGRPIQELDDLFLLIGGSLAGTEIELGLKRLGLPLKAKATLAKFKHPHPTIASKRPDSVFGLRVDYSSLLQQQPMFLGERRHVNPGVTIRELEPDSPAEAKLTPFLAGKAMVITSVNGKEVTTPAEFYEAARGTRSVRLTLVPATDAFESSRTVTLP
jgi:serine protease Do